ncbi:MAG TPA: alpha-L-rhamnosidase N-terminal domain-containing protein [Bacteroidales bacterium]|nr:alpha-L-rhamnosidase N-terminal domain-containing protein [Bacteroidales bacterium]
MRPKVSILFFVLFYTAIQAQTVPQLPVEKINPGLFNSRWHAAWIAHPTASLLDYGVFHYRKTFNLGTKPGEFIINVSADNRYRLFVNGTEVCYGPARADLEHWSYETIDIAPFLKSGKNLIAAEVWNFGKLKPWAQFTILTAFIVQGNSKTEEVVNTDTSWKVIKDEAYTPAPASSGETLGAFTVVGPCDKVDASLYPWGWEKPGYDDSKWLKPVTLYSAHSHGYGSDINWELTPRKIPFMEQKQQYFGKVRRSEGCEVPGGFVEGKEELTIPSNSKATILLDQSVLTTGYPELVVSKGRNSTIKMTYAESLYDSKNEKGNRNAIEGKKIIGYSDYFLPDGNTGRTFRPLWFRTWRYLQMDITTAGEPLVINSFSSKFAAYPLKENASFDSDLPGLKKIWETGWRTARLCANETYFDCPYYEQLQYIGDTRIQSLISLYVSGDDRLVRNALTDFNESQFFEGLTRSRYPSASPQIIPPFSLYWVDMVNDYWMLRDDPVFIKAFLPGIENVLGWFGRRTDPVTGMLGKVDYWNFVDWAVEWQWSNETGFGGVPKGGAMDGNSSILSMQYAYAAQKAAELFRYFGMTEKAEKYEETAEHLTKAVYDECWDSSKGYLADTPDKDEFSMHAQIFGVLTNTIPEKEQKAFVKRFMNDNSLIQPTMYFRFYLTQALKKTGLADQYTETLGLWYDMLGKGLTTFAENPDPARSDCHAWSASPDYDFLATVAGIRPGSPGFKTVDMEPAPGKLNYIKGQMPHPEGMITFDLHRKGSEGLTGTVVLPKGITGHFTWNGKTTDLKGTTNIDM